MKQDHCPSAGNICWARRTARARRHEGAGREPDAGEWVEGIARRNGSAMFTGVASDPGSGNVVGSTCRERCQGHTAVAGNSADSRGAVRDEQNQREVLVTVTQGSTHWAD